MQRIGIDAAGQHLARCGNDRVVRAREPGDGIEQDDNVLLVLDQSLRFLDDHFGDLHVTRRRLIERAGDDLAAHGAGHFGDFLRPFVDQEHDQHHIRIIRGDRVRDVLQHDCLAGFRRGNEEPALTLADRRDDVDDAAGDVLLTLDLALQAQLAVAAQHVELADVAMEHGFVLLGLQRVLGQRSQIVRGVAARRRSCVPTAETERA